MKNILFRYFLLVSLSACASIERTPLIASSTLTTAPPLIIAHRAGAEDAPENTLFAIDRALKNGADLIWLTVQLSKDGIPILYRPADLSSQTEMKGAVVDKTLAELQELNAGWNFISTDLQGSKHFPYRHLYPAVRIPTLQEALRLIPHNIPIILDMKALPVWRQAKAVAQALNEAQAWDRVMIYSTEATYQQAFSAYPKARLFESRDATRQRLVSVALERQCLAPPPTHIRVGFEYKRKLSVIEKFTLGEGRSEAHVLMWTPESVACFRKNPNVQIVAFGINNESDYRAAACLGIDAVLSDSPRKMKIFKERIGRSLTCKS